MKGAISPRGAGVNGGEIALDMALAGLALLALATSLCLTPEAVSGLSLCPFHRLSGLPCPGCGLTRSFCAIGHGHFAQAWAFNPFGFVFYVASLGLLAWPLLRRRYPGVVARCVLSPWFAGLPIGLVGAMWVFGAWRLWRLL